MNYQRPKGSDQPSRRAISAHYLLNEDDAVNALLKVYTGSETQDKHIDALARQLVMGMREQNHTSGLIDQFLQEFSLSSQEGIVLMCLAEALLRIPDGDTADALIRDKLSSGDWGAHIGHSDSLLVNASTWGMLLTGRWVTMDDDSRQDPIGTIKRLVAKSGEPAIRLAVRQAMKMMGQEFVLAQSINEAMLKARKQQAKGFSYSYDMLGEAARTDLDARMYTQAYQLAIEALSKGVSSDQPVDNPGISIKLSALHARYEFSQVKSIEAKLYPRLLALAKQAKVAQLGFNIDAEEAERLDISLSLFEKLAYEPALADWQGLGFVVQAYQKRAPRVIDWMIDLAELSGHRFMVRLVKGAYWDTEIKHAQVQGFEDYPVFSRKENTDLSYLVCAQKMLAQPQAFYCQFATHNALTVAAIIALVEEEAGSQTNKAVDHHRHFEFQCLHGMGEALYQQLVKQAYRCRIYAPVGEHKRLLAYLVRRLLENGANTSFVNILANKDQDMDAIVANPVDKIRHHLKHQHPGIALPKAIYGHQRRNTQGMNLTDCESLETYYAALEKWRKKHWSAQPLTAKVVENLTKLLVVANPAMPSQVIGKVQYANDEQIEESFQTATKAFAAWDRLGGLARAEILEGAAELYEQHRFELLALCQLEAGKTLADAVSEYREAVDFLRYYAGQAREQFGDARLMPGPTGESNHYALHGRGVFVCISPWNFPLAIFTGQISAALLAGNAVLAKPAEQTPLIAWRAIQLLHEAGVPPDILHYLPGLGSEVGAKLVRDQRVDGVVFTGGTDTARLIHQTLSRRSNAPLPHLIAETGGLNCMIVDSSALAEQVVGDVMASAFQSAGQRCSALRVLYLQADVADTMIKMIIGAMDDLQVGDQTSLASDVGPIIDHVALRTLEKHIDLYNDHLLARTPIKADEGHFFAPSLIKISGIEALEKEVFGPVLHVATFKAAELDAVIDSINQSAYGLTLGIHSRINATIERICERAHVGNIYVNRNIIGAVVGVQAFGGEGLSGTGPKAGGPLYLSRFAVERVVSTDTTAAGGNASLLTLN